MPRLDTLAWTFLQENDMRMPCPRLTTYNSPLVMYYIYNCIYKLAKRRPLNGFPSSPLAVTKRDFVLVGISEDGFASLLDGESGAMDESLTLPPPAHLRRNTEEESEMYKTLVRVEQCAWFSFSGPRAFFFGFCFDRCASSEREHKKSMSRCCTPWAWLLFNPLQPVHVRWQM